MANVDAQAGAARYAAKTTNRPGMCLAECQVAMAAPPSIGPYAGQYPTAYSAWLHDTSKHTDANPPRGALVYFGPSPTRTDANKNAGDVCISLGGGLIRCSDGAGSGRMATMTIAARARQIARPYLGWVAPIFLGHTLVNLGAATGGPVGTSTITTKYITDQLGDAGVKEWQKQLGVTADGVFGKGSTTALQKKIGATADGVFGGGTVGSLQAFLGIAQDKKWGPATTLAIKHGLDAKKFAPVVVPPVVVPPVWKAPTEAEYKKLVAERDSLASGAAATQAQLATANTTITALKAKMATAVKDLTV